MKKELERIDRELSKCIDDFAAAGYITMARAVALQHHNGEAARLCRMPSGLISIMEAREVIASMIALDKQPELLSIQAASQQLGYSVSGLRKLAKSGRIQYIQEGRGPLRFTPEALGAFMHRGAPKAAPKIVKTESRHGF